MGKKNPCEHCGEAHHHFAACADGWRNPKYVHPRFGIERDAVTNAKRQPESSAAAVVDGPADSTEDAAAWQGPVTVASPEAPEGPSAQADPPASPPAATEASPALSEAEQARQDLRGMIAALPEDSSQRASLQRLLDRDEARSAHAAAERDLQQRTGNPDARIPVPTIIRDRSEDRGRALEGELARVLNDAGRTQPTRAEALQTKQVLASLPQMNEQKAVDQIMRTAPLEGGQNWICRNSGCGERFKAATLDEVRRYAKEHPNWTFVCPTCKGRSVELVQLEAIA